MPFSKLAAVTFEADRDEALKRLAAAMLPQLPLDRKDALRFLQHMTDLLTWLDGEDLARLQRPAPTPAPEREEAPDMDASNVVKLWVE